MDVTAGGTTNGTKIQLWDCKAWQPRLGTCRSRLGPVPRIGLEVLRVDRDPVKRLYGKHMSEVAKLWEWLATATHSKQCQFTTYGSAESSTVTCSPTVSASL
jgi:hypothetical protein